MKSSTEFSLLNKLIITLSLLLFLSSCNKTQFAEAVVENTSNSEDTSSNQDENSTDSNETTETPSTCTPVADITRLTKIMFVVDVSGSNDAWVDAATNTECTSSSHTGCIAPTDPSKTFRKGSIQNFLTEYSYKSNFQWGFITFANDASKNYMNSSGWTNSFTSTASTMQSALNLFNSASDNGNTPYAVALNAAKNAIYYDADRGTSKNPQYFVILLTDGYPSDYKKVSDMQTSVNALLNTSSGNVNLSTIFYGSQSYSSSTAAISLLSQMATLGGGQFANVNDPSSGIDINDVIPGTSCP